MTSRELPHPLFDAELTAPEGFGVAEQGAERQAKTMGGNLARLLKV